MSLVTQTVSDLPVVLIVTDQPELSLVHWLGQLFSEHQFFAQVVSPHQFESIWTQLQAEAREIYRVVLVSGFGVTLNQGVEAFKASLNASQSPEIWQSCLSILRDQPSGSQIAETTAILGIHSWQAPAAKHAFVASLARLSTCGSHLAEQVKLQLPAAQVFLGWDCLIQSPTPTASVESVELPLLFSIISAQARVLFDPQQPWRLQTIGSFFTAIAQQLLKPHRPVWIVVQGKLESSQVWLGQAQELVDRYFAYRPTLVPVALPETISPQLADVVCQTDSEVGLCLDAQLRTLPHALAQLDQLSEFAASQGKVLRWEPHSILAGLEQMVGQPTSPAWANTTSPLPASIPLKAASISERQQPVGLIQKKTNKTLTQQSKNPGILKNTTASIEPTAHVSPVDPLSLDTELRQLFEKGRGGQRQERLEAKVKVTQKIVAKSKRHRAIFYLGAAAVILGLGGGVLWGAFELSLGLARHQWHQDLQALSRQQLLLAGGKWGWQTPLEWQLKLYKPFLKEDLVTEAAGVVELDKLARLYSDQSKQLTDQTGVLMTQVVGQQSLDLPAQLQRFSELVKHQQSVASQFSAQLKTPNAEGGSADLKQQANQLLNQLKQDESNFLALNRVLAAAPSLLGATEKQTYAVILQDQRELRPTGGFIQSVGKLTFSQGMLTDHSFQSVYDLDNKLASQVVPPDEVKRFLGESRWYLRDSNWNPDFPATAKQINFFLQESTGRPVDGVIGLTFEGVRQLLQATGPLDIPELNEQVTDKNLYDRLEFHAETKSVEINGEKLDYVSLLLDKLVTRLATLEPGKLAQVAAVWSQALKNQDIQLVSLNVSAAKIWQDLGWDGGVIQPTCPSQFVVATCLIDQLYQVDANIGINKVNPYIEKKIVDHIDVKDGVVVHRRTVTYRNQAKLDSWPQGQYLAYVKFLLGKTAEIQSLSVNGVPVSKDQLLSYVEQGSPIIGTPIQVPRQKSTTVELVYQLKLPDKLPFSYFFFNQKQPGITEAQDVLLSYRRGLKPRLIAPQAELASQLLNFHLQRDGHTFVGVTFESDARGQTSNSR